jgi:hypothetical protein
MKLKDLKTKLQTTTTTNIKSVIVDAFQSWAEVQTKQYPTILWNLAASQFKKDIRNERKQLTMDVWIIGAFNPNTQDKLEVWDQLEDDLDDYLNLINSQGDIQILDLDQVKGEYFWEGSTSGDCELGIQYKTTIKITC